MFERKIVVIFLPININICFGCSKEPSQWDGSFEHPKHMFILMGKKIITILPHVPTTCVWLRNKKNNFQLCREETLVYHSQSPISYGP